MVSRFEHVADTLRRWLMGTLVLGLAGTAVELVLLEHYDEPWQLVPLLLIALAFGVIAWHRARSTAASVRALRITMLLFVVSSAAGVMLHFRGAAEFQLEIDPAMPRSELIRKVMRAKDPPVLAPGLMLQLGLIGLAYAYACRVSPAAAADTNHKE
jgi:hypothetical protein